MKQGTKIANSSQSETGVATGTVKRCQMHGCTGQRVAVRWPDGALTWPCSKGLIHIKRGFKIG